MDTARCTLAPRTVRAYNSDRKVTIIQIYCSLSTASARRVVQFRFQHKIGNNSACTVDTTPIPGPNRGLSGSANLTVLVKFVPHQPLLPWQRKFENFNTKLAITRPVWEIRPQFLHGTERKENSTSSYAPRITLQNSH